MFAPRRGEQSAQALKELFMVPNVSPPFPSSRRLCSPVYVHLAIRGTHCQALPARCPLDVRDMFLGVTCRVYDLWPQRLKASANSGGIVWTPVTPTLMDTRRSEPVCGATGFAHPSLTFLLVRVLHTVCESKSPILNCLSDPPPPRQKN